MCLAKVVVGKATGERLEVSDVIAVALDDATLTVTTLFGEERAFADTTIRRIDLQAGLIFVEERPR